MKKTPEIVAKLLFWPTLFYNVLLSRMLIERRWFDRLDDTVFLGALPFRSIREKFENLGIRRVINMCREWPGPVTEYSSAGIDQLWLSTVDFRSPTTEQIKRGVEFITAAQKAGESVYLHCKAGRGRSATVALAWIMHTRGVPAEEAQNIVEAVRPHIGSTLYKREAIREYAERGN